MPPPRQALALLDAGQVEGGEDLAGRIVGGVQPMLPALAAGGRRKYCRRPAEAARHAKSPTAWPRRKGAPASAWSSPPENLPPRAIAPAAPRRSDRHPKPRRSTPPWFAASAPSPHNRAPDEEAGSRREPRAGRFNAPVDRASASISPAPPSRASTSGQLPSNERPESCSIHSLNHCRPQDGIPYLSAYGRPARF